MWDTGMCCILWSSFIRQYVVVTVRMTVSVFQSMVVDYSSGVATIDDAVTVLNKRLVKQLLCLLFVVYKAS